ncbi:MAG: class I SAM-dependent methyltransferase [Dehalococcoidia bacterium]
MVDATHRDADPAREHEHGGASNEDWNDADFVARWLERQAERAPERRRQFALVRAVIPRLPAEEFRYLNLGSGPGNLDELLLDQFAAATATLVDFSLPMLMAARARLARFGDRVEYVHANLASADWAGGVGGSFDVVVSTLAVHHVEDPRRIRALYGEVHRLLGHGGMFLNLDRVRPARPAFGPLAAWAAQDPEAGLSARGHGDDLPGTLAEHLGWLGEAGFGAVDVLWKDPGMALLCGLRDHLHVPEEAHAHDGGEHAHPHTH